jgi:hypothetical protein
VQLPEVRETAVLVSVWPALASPRGRAKPAGEAETRRLVVAVSSSRQHLKFGCRTWTNGRGTAACHDLRSTCLSVVFVYSRCNTTATSDVLLTDLDFACRRVNISSCDSGGRRRTGCRASTRSAARSSGKCGPAVCLAGQGGRLRFDRRKGPPVHGSTWLLLQAAQVLVTTLHKTVNLVCPVWTRASRPSFLAVHTPFLKRHGPQSSSPMAGLLH